MPTPTARCIVGAMVISHAVLLAACSGDNDKRIAGSALMGGALGIVGGPVGIAVGAGVGAAAGAVTPKGVLEGVSQEAGR